MTTTSCISAYSFLAPSVKECQDRDILSFYWITYFLKTLFYITQITHEYILFSTNFKHGDEIKPPMKATFNF